MVPFSKTNFSMLPAHSSPACWGLLAMASSFTCVMQVEAAETYGLRSIASGNAFIVKRFFVATVILSGFLGTPSCSQHCLLCIYVEFVIGSGQISPFCFLAGNRPANSDHKNPPSSRSGVGHGFASLCCEIHPGQQRKHGGGRGQSRDLVRTGGRRRGSRSSERSSHDGRRCPRPEANAEQGIAMSHGRVCVQRVRINQSLAISQG
jgi:hypothetical protein